MADKNLCTVELLDSATINTNVIVEENGELGRLNLQTELGAIDEQIAELNSNITTINSNIITLNTNKVLWSGAYYMSSSHTITLSEAVSAQPTGIVLVWSFYNNGAAQNWDFVCQFIPKQYVSSFNGYGIVKSEMCADGNFWKYIYVTDTQIKGNDKNAQTHTISNITFVSGNYVLRQVIGV